MAAGHVDATIKATVVANTVNDAVIDAPAILAWRNDVGDKIDSNYDDTQTKLATKVTVTTGTGSPIGVVLPTIIGQTYTDRSTGLIYTATALTNASWVIPTPYNFMTQQAIINAAMEVWQTGTSFTNPANLSYTADMWSVGFLNTGTLPTSIIHSQSTLTAGELPNSRYAYNVNVNGAGSGFGSNNYYYQTYRIEHGVSKLCGNGKRVTVSFYAKSSIASKQIAVAVLQNYGTGGSPSATQLCIATVSSVRTLTSSLVLYTFTFTTNTLTGKVFGTNGDDRLEVYIYEMWGNGIPTTYFNAPSTSETFVGSGNITFTQVVVNTGDVALPFQPKSFDDELKSCQRYYEKSYDYGTLPGASATPGAMYSFAASANVIGGFRFKAQKRVTNCTVVIYSPSGTSGKIWGPADTDISSGVTANNIGDGGARYLNAAGAGLTANASATYHYTADARL